MIFFNWEKVIRRCDYDHYKILDKFKSFGSKGVPHDLAGNSFIINIKDLMYSKYYDSEKFDYLILCSIRNYFDYEYQGMTGLWLPMNYQVDKVKVLNNRLLKVTDDYVQFKYEKENDSWL